MATEYAEKALAALIDIEVGDTQGQAQKEMASAIVYALLDVAGAVRSTT